MEENGFSNFIGQAFNRAKKISPGALAGEVGSWWWNRLPDQADRFTRPGIRNKINSAVGTGLVEGANMGTDAIMQAALAGAALLAAPETMGASVLAHPATAWAANLAKDAWMQQNVEPGLYGIADDLLDIGHRIPAPRGYKGSSLQKNVNAVDKKTTDIAQWISSTHPKNKAMEYARQAGKMSKKIF